MAFLLTALAAVDTICLCVVLLHPWLSHVADWDVRLVNDMTCRLHVFLTYLCVHVSAWTLVLVTAERVVSVLLPLRAAKLCCRCRVVAVWCVTVGILTCANSYVHLGNTELTRTMVNDTIDMNGTMDVMEISKCDLKDQGGSSFLRSLRLWGDLLLSCLLPSLFIILGNIIVVFKLVELARKRRSMQSSRLQMNGFHSTELMEQEGLTNSTRLPVPKRKRKKKSTRAITLMLFTVCLVFLFTSLPINIYLIWEEYISMSELSLEYALPLDTARSVLIFTVLSLVYHVNNAVNFILYFISGPLFRNTARERFCGTTNNNRQRERVTGVTQRTKIHISLQFQHESMTGVTQRTKTQTQTYLSI